MIKTMQESVLRFLENQSLNIIPRETSTIEIGSGFTEIFPYGTERHSCFEWMWPIGDWTHIKIDQSVYRIAPGEFCLIAPGVAHAEVYLPRTPIHQTLWFSYSVRASEVHCTLFNYDFTGHGQIIEECLVKVPPVFGTLLVALQNEIDEKQIHRIEICHSLLTSLTHLTIRALETTAAHHQDNDAALYLSRRVVEYLRRHYAESLVLDDIARTVHLSRNYMVTVFKKETGKTIGEALTEIRLEHAKFLLMQPNPKIRDIAKAVGFRSPEHFCRVFQRHENIAPSSYYR